MAHIKTQIGTSDSADFEQNTWTFSMNTRFSVCAGDFAIVPLQSYRDSLIKLNEIIDRFPNNVEIQHVKDSVKYVLLMLEE